MPYFKWRGVNIVGQTQHGKLFAQSPIDLDEKLFRRNIALISSKPVVIIDLFSRITLHHKIEFFGQLHELLAAGVLLPQALRIVADQGNHPAFQQVLCAIASKVQDGAELSVALSAHPKIFDPMALQLVRVGQESGNLSAALEIVFHYLQAKKDFYGRVRSALFMPVITLIFFTILSMVILLVILPRFADMFASLGKELPAITQNMIYVSSVMASWKALYGLVGVMVGIIACAAYARTARGARFFDMLVLKIPVMGRVITYYFISHFLQSIALLLESGMQLVPALRSIEVTISNRQLRQYVRSIGDDVQAGSSLADAISYCPDSIFSADIVALVTVGQQIGTLDVMLKRAAVLYRQKAEKLLLFFTVIINPLLLIFLGALVLLLIFTVYMPILTMSHAF